MSEDVNHGRRGFLSTAALTVAAAELVLMGSADAQSSSGRSLDPSAIKPGTNTSFAALKQIDAGVAQRRLRRGRPRQWSRGHSSARLAVRHSQLCRCCAAACVGGLPRPRAVSARLRHDALSFKRDVPQWPALGSRGRPRRLHGCAQDREGDPRRFRLGRADGQHRRGALAGALQGHGVRQRLSDRQPGGRQDAVAAGGGAPVVVPVLFRHGTRPRRLRQDTGATLRSSSGSSLRRSGSSTTPRSIAARRPSTTRITSAS